MKPMNGSSEELACVLQTKAIRAVWGGTTWIRSASLEVLAGVTPAVVEGWLARRELFALHLDRQAYFPAYAFDSHTRPLPAVAKILRIFADSSDMSVAAWFESTSSSLAGARPRELLQSDPARVIAAAQQSVDNDRYAG